MKIQIKNLGPIDKFTFDVDKDLHMIYGKNSIGKSYAIYCIYICLKRLNDAFSILTRFYFNQDDAVKKMTLINSQLEKASHIDITEDVESLLTDIYNDLIAKAINESFQNTYGSLTGLINRYSNKKPEIHIYIKDGISIKLGFGRDNNFVVKRVEILKKIEYSINKRSRKATLFIEDFPKMPSIEIPYFNNVVINRVSGLFYSYLRQNTRNVYFLPSSRSGLYLALSSFSPIIAELSKSRFQFRKKIELPSLSEPISDYFIPLASVNTKKTNNALSDVISTIETNILKGKVSIDNDNNRIIFEPHGTNLNLDLSATSSMVSEIAPIVTYLKHIVFNVDTTTIANNLSTYRRSESSYGTAKNIIFIEEPEAHLHPEVQIMLMAIFTELTKYNLKIVITSHSNYMFYKLGNIILDKAINFNNIDVTHLEMTATGSSNKNDMQASEEGIDDNNFSLYASQLYEERMNILEKENG